MSNTARKDLERFLHERLNTLHEDMMWRCQESDLLPTDWYCMMTFAFLQGAANIMAEHVPANADKELASLFYQLIQHARAEHKRREARRDEDEDKG